MIYLLIFILLVGQSFLFYLNRDRIKKYWDIPVGSIILKPIPKSIEVEDVEGLEELLSNVMKSAKDECWKCEFQYGVWSGNGYHMIITSPDGLVSIDSIIRMGYSDADNPRILRFNINTRNKNLNIGGTKYYNEIIIFLWDFILQKHINENSDNYKNIKFTIDHISKNLKSLNRNKILDQLLKKD